MALKIIKKAKRKPKAKSMRAESAAGSGEPGKVKGKYARCDMTARNLGKK